MFENVWFFYTPVVASVSSIINNNWGTDLITPSAADYVSIRWSGLLKPNYGELYTFFLDSDDGSSLWIDNVNIINRWDTNATMTSVSHFFHKLNHSRLRFFCSKRSSLCFSPCASSSFLKRLIFGGREVIRA